MLRSLLFVPGDSEKKLAKSEGISADALILDLEDSVVAENKTVARGLVCEFLAAHAGLGCALSGRHFLSDIFFVFFILFDDVDAFGKNCVDCRDVLFG